MRKSHLSVLTHHLPFHSRRSGLSTLSAPQTITYQTHPKGSEVLLLSFRNLGVCCSLERDMDNDRACVVGMNMSSNHLTCQKNWCLISISISSPLPLSHAHTYPPPLTFSAPNPPQSPKPKVKNTTRAPTAEEEIRKKKPADTHILTNPSTVSIIPNTPEKESPQLEKKKPTRPLQKSRRKTRHLEKKKIYGKTNNRNRRKCSPN